MIALWALLATAAVSDGEVLMTVTPELVLPGVTPSFSLHCGLLDSEGVKIVSLSISRRTHEQGNLQSGQAERLASLPAMSPMLPEVNPVYPSVTALGQITSFESELGSYVELVWPEPRVQDLGLYTCEALVIGETGQLVTVVAQSVVTAGDIVIDSIMLRLSGLERTLDSFNSTVLDLEARLDNISAVQEIHAEALAAQKSNQEEEEEEDSTEEVVHASTTSLPVTDSPIERLVSGLDVLFSTLDRFNSSMSAMKDKLDKMELDQNDDNGKNETSDEDGHDHVITFFTHNTSTFFLIAGPQEFNSYTAQALCDSQGTRLAEVGDAAEMDVIFDKSAPYVLRGQRVLVGGRRGVHSDLWRFQETGHKVTFFGGPSSPPEVPANQPACLALQKTRDGMAMVGVACGEPRPQALMLCQKEATAGEEDAL